jgi:hypothetical protein
MFSEQELLDLKEVLDEWGPGQAYKFYYGHPPYSWHELEVFVNQFMRDYNTREFNK